MERSAWARRLRIWALLAVLVLVASSCALLRPQGAAPLRFRDQVFVDVTTTGDITYGESVRQDGTTKELKADLYEPTGDSAADRPLIIWVHGGSFAFGDKTSPEIVDQARIFAHKGYVSASISYRLSDQGCTEINATCVESIFDAVEDAQAAVRFFRANADEYRIDTDRIAIAGTSAGAITALNVGYGTEVPDNSGTPGYSSEVDAAVSLSGAQFFNGSIDGGDAPSLLFHGTEDSLVPYSQAISTREAARDAGLVSWVVTWYGDGHVPYVEHRDQILEVTTNFVYNTLEVGDP